MPGLQTEIWTAGIIENPIPNSSFVSASEDMSEFVENNVLHLAEAGIDPSVHENYFQGNENPLPVANIEDIPNQVVLNTYSTDQTRHRQLQEVELQYNRRESIVGRHRKSLGVNIGKRAAFSWTTDTNDAYNRKSILGGTDSVIDAIIDMQKHYSDLDKDMNLNVCLTPDHLAKIKKEDKTLYKDIMKGMDDLYGFKVWRYSQNPIFTAAGTKKPYGSTLDAGDKRASFFWDSTEVFRCLGTVEMYATLRDSGLQADTLSFAQRALVGKIRANNPKYLGTII